MLPKEDQIEENSCKERIRSILGKWKVNIANLEDTETRRVRMRNQINGSAILTFDVLRKVAYSLPQVSCDWLLLGEGDMMRAEHVGSRIYQNSYNNQLAPGSIQKGPVAIGHDTVNVIRNREIQERDDLIAQLKARVEELEKDKKMLQWLLDSVKQQHPQQPKKK